MEKELKQEHYPNVEEEKDGSAPRDSVPAHGESEEEDEGCDNGMAHVKEEEEEEEEEEEAPASEESFV